MTIPAPKQGALDVIVSDLRRNAMVVALILVVILFALLTNGVSLRSVNISNLMVQNGYVLILAIGMLMVILGGHIDLSVGAIAGLVGALSGVFAVRWGLPWGFAVALSLMIGAAIGAFQGFWVAFVGVPSFIVTLGGMLTFRGLTLVVLQTQNIGSFPPGYRALGNGFLTDLLGEYAIDPVAMGLAVLAALAVVVTSVRRRRGIVQRGRTPEPLFWFAFKQVLIVLAILGTGLALASHKGVPVILIIVALLGIGYSVVTQRTAFGRHLYALGGNRQAAALSGVQTKWIDFFLFVNMGVLAALAGIVFTARLNLASPSNGSGFELEAIAAAFVGGAAVQGGYGTVGAVLIGGIIIGVLNNGMSILGLGTEWQQTVKGLVLLAAVAFDILSKRRAG
jgi:putative multiple sugar transport system permease protein